MSTTTVTEPAVPAAFRSRRTHVTTMGNFKGGTGKSSAAVNMACALARQGYTVLVVDLDPQANATRRFDAQLGEDTPTVSEIIEQGARRPGCAADAIVAIGFDAEYAHRIKIIPATIELTNRAKDSVPNAARRLYHALSGAINGFDYVLIDCGPTLGDLTHLALAASDDAVIVTEPETDSMEGAGTFVEFVYRWRTVLEVPHCGIIGIIVSKVRNLSLHRQRIEILEGFVGSYFPEGIDPAPVWDPHIPLTTVINTAHEGKAIPVIEVLTNGDEMEKMQLVGIPVETQGAKGREISEIYDKLAKHYIAATGGE